MTEIKYSEFKELEGQTIVNVLGMVSGSSEVVFKTKEGNRYKMHHWQDCCEHVYIADIDGDETDLVGGLVVSAEEVISKDWPEDVDKDDYYPDSFTWTFYKIQTTKGHVWMRWLGESNGYYSESVDFEKVV